MTWEQIFALVGAFGDLSGGAVMPFVLFRMRGAAQAEAAVKISSSR